MTYLPAAQQNKQALPTRNIAMSLGVNRRVDVDAQSECRAAGCARSEASAGLRRNAGARQNGDTGNYTSCIASRAASKAMA